MADNYLEKKMEEYRSRGSSPKTPVRPSLDTLLLRNRSCRGYRSDYIVKRRQLECLVEAASKTASARNAQVLRYRLISSDEPEQAAEVLKTVKMGGALPELHLPFPGTEPDAFIVVCSSVPETRYVDIDLGISLQTMLLKATELGLNGLIICAFDKDYVRQALDLPYDPLCVVAIGKSAETYELSRVGAGESLAYYRKDGVHIVPKLRLEDLLI